MIAKINKDRYNKYMNYMIIGYAFVLPMSKAGVVFFEILLISMWIFEGNFKYKIQEIKKSKTILILASFILFSFISFFWSSDTSFALLYIKKYWHFLVIPAIYTSINSKYIKHIFAAFLLGVLATQTLSYSIFFEWIQYKNISPSNPSPFMNGSDISLFLCMASILILNIIFSSTNLKYKILYMVLLISTVSNLFINTGRTGQVAFVIALSITLILNIKNKITAILSSILLVLIILISAYNVSPIFNDRSTLAYNDIKAALFEKDYSQSFGQRVSLWIMGVNVAYDNLPLGTGIGDERVGMQKYANKYNVTIFQGNEGYIDYHSTYIQYFTQLGIVGLLLTIYLSYSLFTLKFTSILYRNINIGFATTIFTFSTVSGILHIMGSMTLFAFFTAVLNGISRIEH